MELNGESIYGCGPAELPRPDWGRYTRRGNTVYAHLFEEPIGPIALFGLAPEQVKSVRMLRDGSEVKDGRGALGARKKQDTMFVTLGTDPNYTCPLPDRWDTVLKIELASD